MANTRRNVAISGGMHHKQDMEKYGWKEDWRWWYGSNPLLGWIITKGSYYKGSLNIYGYNYVACRFQ